MSKPTKQEATEALQVILNVADAELSSMETKGMSQSMIEETGKQFAGKVRTVCSYAEIDTEDLYMDEVEL